jgi:hypothetical protein
LLWLFICWTNIVKSSIRASVSNFYYIYIYIFIYIIVLHKEQFCSIETCGRVEKTGLYKIYFIVYKVLIFNLMYLAIISNLLPLAHKNLCTVFASWIFRVLNHFFHDFCALQWSNFNSWRIKCSMVCCISEMLIPHSIIL